MKLYELELDAQLTREMVKEFGEEYSIGERISLKMHGIGNLKLINAHPPILEFYESRDHAIKTHFAWTKGGAVIRIRTMEKNYAVGLKDADISRIEITKEEDRLYPLAVGNLLLNLGLSHRVVRWIPFGARLYRGGKVEVKIVLIGFQPFIFELKSDLWKGSLSTFVNAKTIRRINTVDKGLKIVLDDVLPG